MEAESETQCQILGPGLGVFLRRGRKDYRIQGVRDIGDKPVEFASLASLANGNLQSLNQKAGVLYGTNLHPLHIWDSCIAWSICRSLDDGMKGCPYCFGWLL